MNKHELLECIKKADENPAETDSSVLTGFSGGKDHFTP